MLKRLPKWLTAKCETPVSLETYEQDRSALPPYIIIGSSGYLTDDVVLVQTAFAAAAAHSQARAAIANPSMWATAAASFDALSKRTAIPVACVQHVVENGQANVTALCDIAHQLRAACEVAAQYTQPDVAHSVDLLAAMAATSADAVPYNIIDHTAVVSHQAITSCQMHLAAANQAVESMVSGSAVETAALFQQNVAKAELWYAKAHPTTIPAELKTNFDAARKRVTETYDATYAAILRDTTL